MSIYQRVIHDNPIDTKRLKETSTNPSGKHTKSIKQLLNMAIEIVDLPMNSMVI